MESDSTLEVEVATKINKLVHGESFRTVLRGNGHDGITHKTKLLNQINIEFGIYFKVQIKMVNLDVIFTNLMNADKFRLTLKKCQNITDRKDFTMVQGSMAVDGVGNLYFEKSKLNEIKYFCEHCVPNYIKVLPDMFQLFQYSETCSTKFKVVVVDHPPSLQI